MTAAEFLDTPTPTAPSRGMSAADYLDLPKASEFLEAGQDDAEPPAAAASGDVGRTFLNALLSSARPWATTDYGGRGVHLPSQTSSGFAGPPSAQNMDDWGLVAAMANAGKQEPMAQHLFDFGKNLVTMPLAMPVQAAGELAEQPATDVLNTLARDFTGKMPFQPGKPILSPPDPGTRGVVPAIERTVAGMTTPGNIAMLGLAPGSKLLQEGFLANAAASVPDSFEKMATARMPMT